MCGLMAITQKIDEGLFLKEFNRIYHRGPDQSKTYFSDGAMLGFHRLAIMDIDERGMQPMQNKHMHCLCNGEIYNYMQLRQHVSFQYQFQSESDCEVLLPMYDLYQERMFSLLDGEFALVLYNEKEDSMIAARDHLGIRPLFYGYLYNSGKIAFASEAKALHRLCSEIYPFPIGTYYKDGNFYRFHDCTKVKEFINDKNEIIYKEINQRLEAAVLKRMQADVEIGYLLSGGLDSSLVCAIASKHSKHPIKTFAIGMKEDAIDLTYAKQTAKAIGSEHTSFVIEPEEVMQLLNEVIWHLESYDITTIRASIGMYALCKKIRAATNIKVLISGEVSDELFGYKYCDYAPSPLAFQKESEKRMRELYMFDALRADRCISAHAMEARVPFSDREFTSYVMAIHPSIKMNSYGIGKYLLRAAFRNGYLPESILMREKAAFSDGVGHSLVDYLRTYAEYCYDDAQLSKAQQKYKHLPPLSKEALLYRDIFETCFHKRESLIKSYWMPNPNWPNCDVNDPSARVLPNYGASGY